MDRITASTILQHTSQIDDAVNELCELIKSLDDEGERENLKRAIGQVMEIVARDFVFPITAKYPDLDPER